MKKIAFTMVELTIAIIVILILTAASMSMVKNINANKNRILVYAAIQTLMRGNRAIAEKHELEFYPEDPGKKWDDNVNKTTDWYCKEIADTFTLNGGVDCDKNNGTTDVNFTLPNGITYMGISNPWIRVGTSETYYKNILVDINGNGADAKNKPNKIGVDRFPLRVFRYVSTRSSDEQGGLIYPVNCGSESIAEGTLNDTYCGAATNKMASTNDIIAYNVVRVLNGSTPNRAGIVASSQSAIKADCLAHGHLGLYGKDICNAEGGADLLDKCAHEVTCNGCGSAASCPGAGTEAACNTTAASNKLTVNDPVNGNTSVGFRCFTILAKPTSGLGILGSSILGELGL